MCSSDLEKPGTGDVTLKPMTTKLPDNFGGLKASEFQEDLKVELKNGTVYVSGNLTPVKMNTGWGDNNTGYFVWFDIDASGVAGAKSLIIRGTKGQYASKNHEDFIYQLGDENLKKDDLTSKTTTLYVLNQAGSADTAPVGNTIVKEYPVDFSGVTLKQSVPFTVSHELSDANDAEAVHQSLLCNGTNYKVTVDHSTKEIIVTGDVYMISEGNAPYAWSIVTGNKLGFKQTESGYFVTFEMKPSSVGGFTKYNQAGYSKQYKDNDTTYSSGVVTQVIRVAPMSGENPYGAVKVYVGNEDTVGIEYKLNLKGVNWVSDYKETTTEPSET